MKYSVSRHRHSFPPVSQSSARILPKTQATRAAPSCSSQGRRRAGVLFSQHRLHPRFCPYTAMRTFPTYLCMPLYALPCTTLRIKTTYPHTHPDTHSEAYLSLSINKNIYIYKHIYVSLSLSISLSISISLSLSLSIYIYIYIPRVGRRWPTCSAACTRRPSK